MRKFHFILLFMIGMLLNVTAQDFDIDDLCNVLPETADVDVAVGAPASYLNITITDAFMLEGTYPGWCIDTENGFNGVWFYDDMPVYCSYETLPAGLLVSPDNLDLVNWILNNVSVGDYTMGDIQWAIWTLISDVDELPDPAVNTGFWDYLGTYTGAQEIIDAAELNGEGYVPGYNEYVAVVFDPGVTVQTFIIPFLIPDQGCTLTQGYWKTHGSEGPAGPYDETWDQIEDDIFFFSGMDYYDAIREKAKGNAYYILAHQYIAANLNFLSGADPTDAQDAFDDATALFETYTPGQIKEMKGNNPFRQQFIAAKDVLDDYNNGIIGPGHCEDDSGDKSTEANIDSGSQELVVYPNPMTNSGTIEFIAAQDGQASVEIYNLLGKRVAILYNGSVQTDGPYKVQFNANELAKGMYIVIVRNETTIYKQKLSVIK